MLGDGKSVDCRVPNKHSDGENVVRGNKGFYRFD